MRTRALGLVQLVLVLAVPGTAQAEPQVEPPPTALREAPTPDPEPAPAVETPEPPSPSVAEAAVAVAMEQVGKPYRYGSPGPDSFDCSGLTSFAWRAAGIEIPRTSRAQFSQLPRVPLDQIQPGDLVYAPGHIGMYIGEGLMVHAPRSGRRIEVGPLHSRAVGAVRPAG